MDCGFRRDARGSALALRGDFYSKPVPVPIFDDRYK
jgi:hypothetical protein